MRAAALVLGGWLAGAGAGAAQARVLTVGEGGQFATLDAAARAAQDGDTIRLAPGEYFECAGLPQNRLVLEGNGATLTDKACAGKAILVLGGNGTVVRDLVLARARVPDGNGAGIRLEGQGLTLERVRFVNDQTGLLAGGAGGEVVVTGCSFEDSGSGGDRPLPALLVGGASLLRVENSAFSGGKGGAVSSGADRTELNGNRFAAGGEAGPAAVVGSGGALVLRENQFTVGSQQGPRDGAMVLAVGGRAELRGNRLANGSGTPLTLLLDWTAWRPVLDGNVVGPGDSEVASRGAWRHRAGSAARETYGGIRSAAGAVKRGIKGALGW